MKKVILISVFLLVVALVYCGYFVYSFITPSRGRVVSRYEHPRPALLVIDVQRDLTEAGGKAAINPELTDKMIDNIDRTIDAFSEKNIPVIYIKHEYKPNPLVELITKGALKEGTSGAEMDPRIRVINDDIFIKYKMDPFKGTSLDEFLEARSIDHLYLTGLDAELCIDRTIKAACNRGLKTTVISDGIATVSADKLNRKLEDYRTTCAKNISTDELVKNIEDISFNVRQ